MKTSKTRDQRNNQARVSSPSPLANCVLGGRCAGGTNCVQSSGLNGCLLLLDKCLGCGYALMSSPPLATKGGRKPKPKMTHGYLIYNEFKEFVGWLIRDPVTPKLRAFDFVVKINGEAPDADFFETLAKSEGQPYRFEMEVWRNNKIKKIVVNRK